ncbi:phage terminase family protein [Staphylococcus aureus]|nr:phage terminase family protein [Staphylococcus aureus]
MNYNLVIEKGEAETTRSESGMIDYKQVIEFIINIEQIEIHEACYLI